MDSVTLEAIARQAAVILAPALPFIYEGSKAVVTKGTDVLGDMLYEKAFEKIGSKYGKKAKSLLEKISPKMTESLRKTLTKVSQNSEDPKAKEELQQEILKLLRENPDLAREIEVTINLNIENIENIDQFAVGNYNTFFNFETPSGDEFIKINEYLDRRRKEAANQEILNCYNPSTPPYPEKLKQFVTQNRAEELRKNLTYLENHWILLISGIGGVGKSTLARALVDLRPINVPEPFWFNFNQNQNAKLGDILEKLAAYMNAPEIAAFKAERREPGKTDVDKLTGELHRRSEVWLIFDDLSTVLEDQQFTDKGIELLFSSLRYNDHKAKVIVTSRTLPKFENGESLVDVIEGEEKHHLNGLRKEFAVNYLVSNGLDKVETQKLEELAVGVDGHPLALRLLVQLVKEYGANDILEDLSMYRDQMEDTILKARKLFDKLAGEEKALLERISVYREPVNMKGIKDMFAERTPKNGVKKLIDKSLLETDHNGSYWLHPLVQEFSYDDLEDKKTAHMFAVKYYLSLPLPEKPSEKEDVQPLIEAHHHACMAEEYDQAAVIIWRSNLHYLLDLWGNSKILIEIYEKLLPEDHFKGEPVLKNKKTHRFIIASMGNAYSHLGEPRKAIEYYKQAHIISKEIEDKQGEGEAIGNLGNEYSHLGEFRKAIKYYEKSLKIARERRDIYGESAALGNLGTAYTDLKEPRKAIEYYEQSLKISIEIVDRRGEAVTLGNIGTTYREMGEPRKAIEYYEQALKIDREIGDKQDEARNLENMGLAFSLLGEHTKAIEYCEQALKIAREVCDRIGESETLGNMGSIYYYRREFRQAVEYYEQALKINRKIGDIYGQSVDLRNLGSAYKELRENRKAIEYYEQALEISIEMEDGCKQEVENLILLWIAYCNLGEPRETVEFLKKYLAIGKAIEDPRIIGFCEQELKELEGSDE
ncbi:hypothetical protein MSLAZ_1248 [Methanosarcina lacustris Z-7289]|uniref:Uncharacterized protein n=1 Tax=Methanosarcina lacustris Z-7289 TaxID=1434111 RepID=A0A0E3S1B7_9EURY|nr:tetratricopeptide repeat protein [Methanosarcina lacustris]AKB74509.1 hypothetical protein MSLAZ_1248 [Methanosarcina lacustris Z-7289]